MMHASKSTSEKLSRLNFFRLGRSVGSAVWRVLLLAVWAVPAQASDVVYFGEGNKLVGEVKYLERGRLYFNTDATGTIPIDWEDVQRLMSDQLLRVETVGGTRYFGGVDMTEADGEALVQARVGKVTLNLVQIVAIQPLEEKFWERFDASISVGYNFTKATEVSQLTIGASIQYLTENWRSNAQLSSNVTEDSTSDAQVRHSLNLNTRRLRGPNWATGGFTTFERNDALGLDLRTSLGSQIEWYLRNDNRQRLALNAGLLVSREEVRGSSDSEGSLESAFSTVYELFRYDSPEIDLKTKLLVLPSITDWGRVRSEFNITLKWELYRDLFWQLSFYDTFDSQPPAEDAAENDYGIVTSLAFDF